jgi:probable O-glycosylation ligase (exosortase A-associated)
MRAILILALLVALVPLAFFAPFTGLLTFVWIAYLRPHEWAYAPTWQISLIVAVVTLLGYCIFELPRRSPKLLSNALLVLLWAQVMLSTVMAEALERPWPKFIEFTKIIIMALLMTAMVDSEKRVRWLLLVTLGAIGLLAVRANIGIILSRGAARISGPGGAFEDNNDFALLLNMALPMMIYFGRGEAKRWLRWGFYALAGMTLITILFTYSRGGFLGLCVLLIALAFKTRYKLTGLMAGLVLITVLLAVVPSDIVQRLSTIQTAAQADESARSRLRAWRVSLWIIKDHPVFGVGLRNILEVYTRYGAEEDVRVSHNAYLQMAVDAGLPALVLFVGAIGLCYWRLRKTRKMLKIRAPGSRLITYAHGMEVALVGYLVSATFLSRHDLELLYQVMALAASFILIARSYEREAEARELVSVSKPAFAAEPATAAPHYLA